MTVNKGCYILIVELQKENKIESKSKSWNLKKGFYAYVGSAMNSLSGRLSHHLSEKKKLHWHIDYLLNNEDSKVVFSFILPSQTKREEQLSSFVSNYGEGIKGFGSSDCKTKSNLYRVEKGKLSSLFTYLINLEVSHDCFFK
jgi:Uri superfamily endonuclease